MAVSSVQKMFGIVVENLWRSNMCTRMTGFDHLYVRGHYAMSKEPRDCYTLHQSFRLQAIHHYIKRQNSVLGRALFQFKCFHLDFSPNDFHPYCLEIGIGSRSTSWYLIDEKAYFNFFCHFCGWKTNHIARKIGIWMLDIWPAWFEPSLKVRPMGFSNGRLFVLMLSIKLKKCPTFTF